ncbi:MAG: leucine-rich repeat domain-containing protein [Clostridia bacterium]|nr:leucine-rich repeat domain-containing protein [Clostridia bacterium]
MKKRLIIISILVICILCTAFAISACIVKSKDLFVVEGDVIVDTTYSGRKETYINIPEGIVGIGDEAFYNCYELTSIFIPSSVTSIGTQAFASCNKLTSITVDSKNTKYFSEGNCIIEKDTGTLIAGCNNSVIPNSVTSIMDYAFFRCMNLTTINIPDSVVSVGKGAFSDCYKLESVVIPGSVKFISESMFYWCMNLKNVDIADGVIGIEERAFMKCGDLANIKIPDSVTSIGKYAFDDCVCMTSIEIPSSVTEIASNSFNDCSSLVIRFKAKDIPDEWRSKFTYGTFLERYDIPIVLDCDNNDVAINGYVYTVAENGVQYALKDAQAKVTGHSAISGDVEIADSIVYDGRSYKVTEIDRYSFYKASDVNSVEILDGVKTIGNYAFYYCGLIELDLPIGIEQIGDSAFSYCYSLKSVQLPSGLTRIGKDVFSNCLALGSITVKIGDRVNFVSSGNCLIEKATNKLIAGCKDSVIPDNVKIIGEYAFANCNHLYNIEIPDGVIEIEEAAFYSSGLEKIVLPSSVISIGKRAFEYCRSLQRADIPSSVTSIGKDAFAYCKRDMNIYCEAKSQPSGWDSQWCAGNCKVKWGVDR